MRDCDDGDDHDSDKDFWPDESNSESQDESLSGESDVSEIIAAKVRTCPAKVAKEEQFKKSFSQGQPLSFKRGYGNATIEASTEKEQIVSVNGAEKDIQVAYSINTKGKRKWDKPQFCLYCSERKSKIARHLQEVHDSELEVVKATSITLDKKDNAATRKVKLKERKNIFEKLRKLGNFNHNIEVIKNGSGVLVVEKRPQTVTPYTLYLPCEHCYGFYHKVELRRHIKTCKQKPLNAVVGKRVQSYASMLLYCNPDASTDLKKILNRMNVDEVSLCVKNDELIIKYGNALCTRLRRCGDQQQHISNKLRELGRLVLEARKCCEKIKSLTDCLTPILFDFVLQAVSELSGWNEEDGTVRVPSIGIKLGHTLKKVAKILKGEAIMNGMHNIKGQADDFCSLLEIKWNDEIAKLARNELEQRKWNRPQLLPLTSDLQKLRVHLKQTAQTAISLLSTENSNINEWRNLATSTLTGLILFNRRRGGEPALMKIEDFEKRMKGGNMNDEVRKSLSAFELKLCNSFQRVELRGKRGRKVPLLITREAEKAIKLIIELRSIVGVSSDNRYVFSVPTSGSLKNIRGPDAMRKHVNQCGMHCAEAICSTNLRKHVATLSQILNLTETELEMLAKFLGHDIKIHREYYRLPEDTLQLAKCSKLLLIMEKGVSEFNGKPLNEIELDINGKCFYIALSSVFKRSPSTPTY